MVAALLLVGCTDEETFESEYFTFADPADSVQSKAQIQPVPTSVDDDRVYYCREGPYDGRQVVLKGLGPRDLLTHAYGVTEARATWEASLPDTNFIAEVIVPTADRDRLMRRLQQAVDDELGVDASIQSRRLPVLKLTRLDADSVRLADADDGRTVKYTMDPGTVSGNGITTDVLRHALEVAVGRPVVDEVMLERRVQVDLQWEAGQIEDLRRQLEKRGIGLVESEESIRVLVVRDRESRGGAGP